MKISDNGKSFDVRRTLESRRGNRLGLIGMRERMEMIGGRLHVESKSGVGTSVIAWIPAGAAARKPPTRACPQAQ